MYLVVLREVIDLTYVSIKDNECSFSDVAATGSGHVWLEQYSHPCIFFYNRCVPDQFLQIMSMDEPC